MKKKKEDIGRMVACRHLMQTMPAVVRLNEYGTVNDSLDNLSEVVRTA
jgi:hypothetical protein